MVEKAGGKLNPIEFVNFARQGGQIRRFHMRPTLHTSTVAAHSFGVACIVNALYEGDPPVKVLQAALYHDLAECIVGDIPRHTKRIFPEIGRLVEVAESDVMREHGLELTLELEEEKLLQEADLLEMLYYIVEERRMGNQMLDSAFGNGARYLEEMRPSKVAMMLQHDVISHYLALGGVIV
jgi:5'-deoxynucleotidase YfbR-like HD superfamily hydrolase